MNWKLVFPSWKSSKNEKTNQQVRWSWLQPYIGLFTWGYSSCSDLLFISCPLYSSFALPLLFGGGKYQSSWLALLLSCPRQSSIPVTAAKQPVKLRGADLADKHTLCLSVRANPDRSPIWSGFEQKGERTVCDRANSSLCVELIKQCMEAKTPALSSFHFPILPITVVLDY